MLQRKNENIELTVQKESSRLLNFIMKRIPDEEEAKDILQDVFYQLVIGYEEIKALDNVASWLFKVAKNKIIDRSRKKNPEPLSNKQKLHSGMLPDYCSYQRSFFQGYGKIINLLMIKGQFGEKSLRRN